eukprot:TRINITY_DN208_c0_g2_i1.p1 TRINITY_DN208_c0_g2~~TRINITY_DN208_c0_g2_i1.p1  ORF type:complete len:636 (+),score=253.52 TRINITY_DN208_c0_g2_i1:69-1976(+)
MAARRSKTPSTLPPLPPPLPADEPPPTDSQAVHTIATAPASPDRPPAKPAAPALPLGAVKWREEDVAPETVIRIEEFIAQLHSWGHSQRVRRDAAAAAVQGNDMMAALVARPQLEPPKLHYENTMLDWDLEVPLANIAQPDDEPELIMWEILQRRFAQLENAAGAHAEGLWQRLAPLGVRLARVHRMLSQTKLHSVCLCEVVQPALDKAYATAARNALDEPFDSIDQRANELLSECAEVTRELVNCTADGEMELAVDRYVDKADLLERVLDIITAKYDLIGDERRHFVRTEMTEWDQLVGRIEFEADRLLRETVAHKEKRQRDLSTLHEQARRRMHEADERGREHARTLEESDALIAKVTQQQDAAWAALAKQEAVLRELAEQRLAAVRKRLESMDAERERIARREAEGAFYRRHRLLLRLSVEGYTVLEEALAVCRGFVSDVRRAAVRHLEEYDTELCRCVDAVDEQYDAIYRDLCICVGDVIYKKDRKLHMLVTRRDHAEMKRELLSDRLDPEAKRYYEQSVECTEQIARVREELVALRRRLVTNQDNYRKRAGERLEQRLGDSYTPPEQALGERNLARRERMLKISELLVDPEKLERSQEDLDSTAVPAAPNPAQPIQGRMRPATAPAGTPT